MPREKEESLLGNRLGRLLVDDPGKHPSPTPSRGPFKKPYARFYAPYKPCNLVKIWVMNRHFGVRMLLMALWFPKRNKQGILDEKLVLANLADDMLESRMMALSLPGLLTFSAPGKGRKIDRSALFGNGLDPAHRTRCEIESIRLCASQKFLQSLLVHQHPT